MQSRTVGLRIALFGILTLVLGAVMVTTGGADGFAPSEVLAAEKVGVPVVPKAIVPPAARVSPFFARPVLNRMQLKASFASSRSGVAALRGKPVLDASAMKARLASLRVVEDSIPWGYYPIEGAAQVYYAGSNTWYVDTYYLWDLLDFNRNEYWPMVTDPPEQSPWPADTQVEWLWAIYDEYEEPVAGCWYWDDHCAFSGWLDRYGPGWLHSNEEYECVGNEFFFTIAVGHYYEDYQWKWKVMGWDEVLDLGCD